jgi:bifunctional UDP-N-acetylglucosamine pyrophosphorylase/glucosamine-1-phosphate N-acetyltransferase
MVSALIDASPVIRKNRARDILAVPADRPLVQPKTLKSLLASHRRKGCSLTILSCGPDLDRDSIAVFRAGDLAPLLPALARAGGKAGLGSLAAMLTARGRIVGLTEIPDADEALRVAGRSDLARAAGLLRGRKNEALARRGVTLLDPQSTWIDWEAKVGAGTVIYPSVVIEGASVIGKSCRIYPHVHIMRSRAGERVKVLSSTVLEDCRVEDGAQVGPFSRLRPGTVIKASAKVGNFVEMKNTVFGPRSKAQHLSYIGDSLVEEDVNIGAGTITCNYDGVRKSRTYIGSGAFIGSGTELVAPVKVGKQAYIAAGSTITRDVGPASLAIGRARQVERPGWVIERLRKLQKRTRAPK